MRFGRDLEPRIYALLNDRVLGLEMTHGMSLNISLKFVIWFYDTDQNILVVINELTKYLTESCSLQFYEHFYLKYFPKYAFVRKISAKRPDFGYAMGMKGNEEGI